MSRTSRSIMRPFIAAALVAALTVGLVVWLIFREVGAAERRDLHRLQDALCGLVVPIAGAHITSKTQPLGHTIVIASKHSVQVLHCPPPKGHP